MVKRKRDRKADNGSGSVAYSKARERWRAAITLGWEGDGAERRQVRRESYHRTEEAARAWLRAQQEAIDARESVGVSPLHLPQIRTVGDWFDWWLENALTGTVAGTTERTYRDVAKHYIRPYLDHIELTKLQPAHVSAMLHQLVQRGKAGNTLRAARTVLSKALARAEAEGLVQRNAARLAGGIKGAAHEGRTLTPAQAQRLLAELRGERYGAAFLLTLACGLRRGEVLALRWSDLDRHRRSISIRRSLRRIDGRWVPEEPKTRMSRRVVFISPAVIAALDEWAAEQTSWREEMVDEWTDNPDYDDLIFTTEVGTPIDGRNFHRYLVRATEAAGLGKWSPHELRHSAASLMLAEGVPLKDVSETLGHSSIRVTADVYSHLLEPARRDAAEAMSRALALDGE